MTKKDFLILLSVLFAIETVYLWTSCPVIYPGDSAELVAAMTSAGIAHPPGYPLWIMLGYLWIGFFSLFTSLTPIYLATLLTGLWSIAGLFFFFQWNQILLRYFFPSPQRLSLASLTLTLGFSYTLWNQSVLTEVYTFSFFLINLLLFCLMKTSFFILPKEEVPKKKKKRKIPPCFSFNERQLFVLGLLLSTSIFHHLTLVFLLPSFFYLSYAWRVKFSFSQFRSLIFGGLIGAVVLLYLPIRSSMNPSIDWGNPETLKLFFEHITGKLYQGKLGELTSEKLSGNLSLFLTLLWKQGGFSILFFAAAGIRFFKKNYPRLLIFFFLFALFPFLYSISYDIPDIEAYYFPVWTVLFSLAVFGMSSLLHSKKLEKKSILLCVFLLFLYAPSLYTNYRANDLSHDYYLEDYINNFLKTIPPGSLVIISGDDNIGSFEYKIFAEKKRQDLKFIGTNFLRYPWYTDQLREQYPSLKIPPNPGVFSLSYLRRLIRDNLKNEKIYAMFDREKYQDIFSFVPSGFTGRLWPKEKSLTKSDFKTDIRPEDYHIRGYERVDKMPEERHSTIRIKSLFTHHINTFANLIGSYINHEMYAEADQWLAALDKIAANKDKVIYLHYVRHHNAREYKKARQYKKVLVERGSSFIKK